MWLVVRTNVHIVNQIIDIGIIQWYAYWPMSSTVINGKCFMKTFVEKRKKNNKREEIQFADCQFGKHVDYLMNFPIRIHTLAQLYIQQSMWTLIFSVYNAKAPFSSISCFCLSFSDLMCVEKSKRTFLFLSSSSFTSWCCISFHDIHFHSIYNRY